MSINLPTHFVQQYSTNVELLLQQKGSKLRECVTVGSYTGKQASPVDQIGAINASLVASRFEDMPRVDAATDRRWVFPSDYDLPQLIDSFDKLRMITDPQSAYVQNAVSALGRSMDDVVITACFGTAKTGESGSTSTTFGTGLTSAGGRNVAVALGAAAATGLNVAKLREGKRYLMANEVDDEMDPLYCIVTAQQHDNLLSEIQITSADFNDRPVLVDGRVTRFLGINFIHCERLTTGTDNAAGTSRAIPLFARSGMHLGIWNDITNTVSQRHDLRGEPWQVYSKMTVGATRIEEDKVARIWCRE